MNGWELNVEREVRLGVYAKLLSYDLGWPIWRIETVNGVFIRTAKAADGGLVTPLGVANALFGGAPRIEVTIGDIVFASMRGRYLHTVKAEMREVGGRFPSQMRETFDPAPLDGRVLEVVVQSMPTPRRFSELRIDRGLINMQGLAEAVLGGRAFRNS